MKIYRRIRQLAISYYALVLNKPELLVQFRPERKPHDLKAYRAAHPYP